MLQAIIASTLTNSERNDQSNHSLRSIAKTDTDPPQAPDQMVSKVIKTETPENRQQALQNRQQHPHQEEQAKTEKKSDVSQALLDKLQQNISKMHNIGLQFSKHEATGRNIIKVINRDTKEVIREIPSEKVLDMAAKMDEMLGILFDKTV